MNDDTPDFLDRIAGAFIRLARKTRGIYQYLTGDRTCVGFVRWMLAANILGSALIAIDMAHRDELFKSGVGVGAVIFVLVVTGPQMFQEAAQADAVTDGPALPQHEFGAAIAIGISIPWYPGLVWQVIRWPSILQVVGCLLLVGFIPALWAAAAGRPGGHRTLVGDIRSHFRYRPDGGLNGAPAESRVPVESHT